MVKKLVSYSNGKYKKNTKGHRHYEKFRYIVHKTTKTYKGRSRRGGLQISNEELEKFDKLITLFETEPTLENKYNAWIGLDDNERYKFQDFFLDSVDSTTDRTGRMLLLQKFDEAKEEEEERERVAVESEMIDRKNKHITDKVFSNFTKMKGSNGEEQKVILDEIKKLNLDLGGHDLDTNAKTAYLFLCEMVQKSDGPITIENFKEKILEGYRLKLIKFHKLKDDFTLDQALADREEKRRSPRSPSSPKSPGGGSKRRSNSRRRIKSRKTKKTRTTRRLLMKHRR